MKFYRRRDLFFVPALLVVLLVYWLCIPFRYINGCPTITGNDYSPSALLQSANKLLSLGDAKAYRVLRSCASWKGYDLPSDERVILLCRMLYVPRRGAYLRPPRLGVPVYLPQESMPHEKWPHFPLVFSEGIPFLLIDGYAVYGIPESSRKYLEYCRENGIFRRTLFNIPTEGETLCAIQTLVHSERWAAIKWGDAENKLPCVLNEAKVIHRLHIQAGSD